MLALSEEIIMPTYTIADSRQALEGRIQEIADRGPHFLLNSKVLASRQNGETFRLTGTALRAHGKFVGNSSEVVVEIRYRFVRAVVVYPIGLTFMLFGALLGNLQANGHPASTWERVGAILFIAFCMIILWAVGRAHKTSFIQNVERGLGLKAYSSVGNSHIAPG